MHSLADYASSPLLVVVFTCNHCPIAQMYEQRIARLAADYGPRGVAVVAIQPNAPEAIRVDELDCSDISDSLEEMKIRAGYKHLDYPYLYDGATQQTARAYGPQATPHVFVFDRQRRLRYEGRVDNSYRTALVKIQDARDAIEALLAGRDVAVPHTGVFGCSTKWKEKEAEPPGGSAQNRKPAGEAGADLRGGAERTARQLRRAADAGELLVHFVRACASRVPRPGNHVPHVQAARSRFRHRGDELCPTSATRCCAC